MGREVMAVANDIISSKYKLTDIQNRLVWHLVSRIERYDDEFKEYEYHVTELLEILGMGKGRGYELGEALDKATDAKLYIEDGKGGWIKYAWFPKAHYKHGGGIVLKLNAELRPLLLELKEQFTKLGVLSMMTLTGNSTRRIYMHAKQQVELVKQGYPENRVKDYPIDKLREEMELGKSYENFKDFKRYILEKAEKEINEKSDIRVNIIPNERTRRGRKYQHVIIAVDTPDGDFAKSAKTLPTKPAAAKYRKPTKCTLEDLEESRKKAFAELMRYVAKRFDKLGENDQEERLLSAEAQLELFPGNGDSSETKAHRKYREELERDKDPGYMKKLRELEKQYNVWDIIKGVPGG
jgi:hypothetical protein